MSLIHEAVDKRKEYAQKLREFADLIEKDFPQPAGMFIFYVPSQSIAGYTCLEKEESGFNRFEFLGFLQTRMIKLILEGAGKE